MRFLLLISLLLLVCTQAAQGAPAALRPYSGSGILMLRPDPGEERLTLVLYRDPGVERVAELSASLLPRLAGSEAEPVVAVAARKGGWALIAYDEAGREGWLELRRSWRYLGWEEFLPGQEVRILPGLKKGWYALRREPDERGGEQGHLARDQEVRVLRVEGDWALLESPAGWFRWRDGDGRLTISLPQAPRREKR